MSASPSRFISKQSLQPPLSLSPSLQGRKRTEQDKHPGFFLFLSRAYNRNLFEKHTVSFPLQIDIQSTNIALSMHMDRGNIFCCLMTDLCQFIF